MCLSHQSRHQLVLALLLAAVTEAVVKTGEPTRVTCIFNCRVLWNCCPFLWWLPAFTGRLACPPNGCHLLLVLAC